MWYDTYKMGFQQGVPVTRYNYYREGLMDHWEIVVFYQDMLEANVVMPMLSEHALHFIDRRLVWAAGRVMS